MEGKLNVALALDLSLHHISQLVEMLDVNGYCQNTKTLKEARDFEEKLMKFFRYRKCCYNCTGYEMWCKIYRDRRNDPWNCGTMCRRYASRHEGGK